jgi:hypothetical protein
MGTKQMFLCGHHVFTWKGCFKCEISDETALVQIVLFIMLGTGLGQG